MTTHRLLNLVRFVLVSLLLFGSIDAYSNDFYWKKKKDKMALGYKPDNGKKFLVTDFIYDADFTDSYYTYNKKREPKPVIFSSQGNSDEWQKQKAFAVKTDEGVGIINGLGEVVVPYGMYDKIYESDFFNGFWWHPGLGWSAGRNRNKSATIHVRVKKDGKVGLIELNSDRKNGVTYKEYIAPKYDYITLVQNFGGTGKNGFVISVKLSDEYHRSPQETKSTKSDNLPYWAIVELDGYFGVLHRWNKEVLPPVYDRASFSSNTFLGLTYYETKYGELFEMVKDKHQCLVFAKHQKPHYVHPKTIESKNSIGYNERELSLGKHNGGRDGLSILYGSSLKPLVVVGSLNSGIIYVTPKYKRVRPLPDDLFDIYSYADTAVWQAKWGIKPVEYVDLRASADKSGWIMCKDSVGNEKIGYWNFGDPRIFDSADDAFASADSVWQTGQWEHYKIGNYVAVRHKKTGFSLPPVYSEITPLESAGDYQVIVTHRVGNIKLYGLVSPDGVIAPAQFDRFETAKDGKYIFHRVNWPDLYGPFDLNKHQMGWWDIALTMTFDPETGENKYNFDSLLDKYSSYSHKSDVFNLYSNLEALGAALDLPEFRALNAIKYAYWLMERKDLIKDANGYITYARWLTPKDNEKLAEIVSEAQKTDENTKDYYAYLDKQAAAEAEARRLEEQRQAAIRAEQNRQANLQAWAQVADALGQMAQGVNSGLNSSAKTKRYGSQKQVQSRSNSGASSSSEYTSTQVLEVWVPGPSSKATATHQFHNWYKRFYGNRWCIFRTKGGKFHTATTNTDTKCAHYDVSGYKYKAIDPGASLSAGRKYYYFN